MQTTFDSLVYGNFFTFDTDPETLLQFIAGSDRWKDGYRGEWRDPETEEGFFAPIDPKTPVTKHEHDRGILVAWMDPIGNRTCSAACKAQAHPNSDYGKHYTIPLYT